MKPILVEVVRGEAVEALHRVHAFAIRAGSIVASVGDPNLVTTFRSSAKPIQALPVVRGRDDLADDEIAIACVSHLARPEQLEVVRRLLAKAPATADDLQCGRPPARTEHGCSGKHAAMLALCAASGWTQDDFHLPGIPVSRPCSPRWGR